MGSHQGSIAARYGIAVALALAGAGCANTHVQLSAGGQPAMGAPGNTPLGALLLLGFIVSSESHNGWAPPPPLDPARRVLEQDCTKPIADWSANLRCR
jgi:hypothetical protein